MLFMNYKVKDVKVFSMIRRKNEGKTLVKHISCDSECKFVRTTCTSNQKWNNDKCQYNCQMYRTCKKK